MMFKNIITVICCLAFLKTWGQNFNTTSLDIGFGFGFNTPLADLKDRFGTMYGGDLSVNFYRGDIESQFGFKAGFFTSDVVKEDPLAVYRTSSGQLLSREGVPTVVNRRMAASFIGIDFKKNLMFLDKNERAKLFVGAGVGLMQHKIRFVEFSKSVTLAFEEYGKGHDRNSRGIYIENQVGVKFRNGPRKFDFMINAFEGFLNQAGPIQFDNMSEEKNQRFDVGLGIKVVWYLGLTAKEVGKDIYY